MEKEFDLSAIIDVLEIIRNKDILEFANLIDYVLDDVQEYEREYLMTTISDNEYLLVKYIESRKRISQEDENE
jgi:hypothetical protein